MLEKLLRIGIQEIYKWLQDMGFFKYDDPKKFNIGLFGPSRIGKTTLIAAMVEEFKKFSDDVLADHDSYLKLSATDQITLQKLATRINDLKAGIDYGSFTTGTLKGTEDHEVFQLSFEEGKNQSFRQVFNLHDFPGGWLQTGQVESLNIKEWDVCILPIDSAVIMESTELKRKKKVKNSLCIEAVDNFISDWVALRENQRSLCILAPVKCETYFDTPQVKPVLSDKSQVLFNRITQEHYKEALDQIRKHPNIECLYMPVNTVGCCYLKRPTWTAEDELEGEYAISTLKGMDRWKPYGPVQIMFEITRFIASYLDNLDKDKLDDASKAYLKAVKDLENIMQKSPFDRTQVLQIGK